MTEMKRGWCGIHQDYCHVDSCVYLQLAESRAQVAALTAQRDATDQERLLRLFDQYGVECQNCGVKIIARGGPDLHEEKRSLAESAGEEEAICGHCAGKEIARLESELRVESGARQGLDGALADVEKRYLQAAEELAVAKHENDMTDQVVTELRAELVEAKQDTGLCPPHASIAAKLPQQQYGCPQCAVNHISELEDTVSEMWNDLTGAGKLRWNDLGAARILDRKKSRELISAIDSALPRALAQGVGPTSPQGKD